MATNFADVMERCIGQWGRWQCGQVLALYIGKIPVAWHLLLTVIIAPPQNFTCATGESDPCAANCTKRNFDKSIFSSTTIEEFDMVCSRQILSTVTQSLVMAGILIGNIFWGGMSDRFGRRIVLLVGCIIQVAAGLATAFIPWLWAYMLLRFLTTFAIGGTMLVSFVLLMEITSTRHRTVVGTLFHLPFLVGQASLGLFGYFIRDWHYVVLAVSAPTLLMISYYWILPESPRWLYAHNQPEKVTDMLERAARCNKMPTDNIKTEVQNNPVLTTAALYRTSDLLKTPQMRKKTLGLCLNWFVIAITFYGLAQYMGHLSGSLFLNVALSGMVQLPGCPLAILMMDTIGRRWALIVSYMMTAVPAFAMIFVKANPTWLKPTMGCIAMLGISMNFAIIYVYTGEIFPTTVRNLGIGVSSMCGRVGGMLAPVVVGLNQYLAGLTPALIAAFPFAGVIMLLFLPETKGKKLPDTLDEGEAAN